MRLVYLMAALALATLALPVASAEHTITGCMNAWNPAPPPGWETVCVTLDWQVGHNPFLPLALCLVDPIEVVGYDVNQALQCL